MDEESLDAEFQKLHDEETELLARMAAQRQNSDRIEASSRADKINTRIESSQAELTEYNDLIVRKTIECIKVLSEKQILIIFKGGYEVTVDIE